MNLLPVEAKQDERHASVACRPGKRRISNNSGCQYGLRPNFSGFVATLMYEVVVTRTFMYVFGDSLSSTQAGRAPDITTIM
jgi:hypothetical protein